MTENYVHIQALALQDVEVLQEKGKTYGSSWRQRGGAGAFMMLARKWDRIENICRTHPLPYDIFTAVNEDVGGILDDIQDLRRYLLLVESYCTAPLAGVGQPAVTIMPVEPTLVDDRPGQPNL